jgi:hypothetical protein
MYSLEKNERGWWWLRWRYKGRIVEMVLGPFPADHPAIVKAAELVEILNATIDF